MPARKSAALPTITTLCRCLAVDLSKNGIGLKGITQLFEVLKNNDTVQTLLLEINSIGDLGAELIAKHLAGSAQDDIFLAHVKQDAALCLQACTMSRTCQRFEVADRHCLLSLQMR